MTSATVTTKGGKQYLVWGKAKNDLVIGGEIVKNKMTAIQTKKSWLKKYPQLKKIYIREYK